MKTLLLQVLDEFYNIFGSELKAVTGDAKKIENVILKVDGLVKPLSVVSISVVSFKLLFKLIFSVWKFY